MSRRPESRQRGRQPYNTQLATERSGMCLFVHQSPNVAPRVCRSRPVGWSAVLRLVEDGSGHVLDRCLVTFRDTLAARGGQWVGIIALPIASCSRTPTHRRSGSRLAMIKLTVNGVSHNVDADPDTPLLWVIREWLGMTGTKYGCGIAQCGACTVHIDGVATRSCQVPAGSVGDVKITTIEGLSPDGLSHPVQVAWLQHDVPQCGYCQSGQIMAAAALLKTNPKPNDDDIDAAITNICRCGTYQRVRAGIHAAAAKA